MRDDYDFTDAQPNPYARKLGDGPLSTPVSRGEQPPSGIVEIYQEADGDFRWRLKTPDGHVLAHSDERYESLDVCREAVGTLLETVACPTTITSAA